MFWIEDPGTGKKSVSLTMLIVAFLAVLIVGILQVIGKATTDGPFKELLYSCIALYFGRRANIGGKLFSLTPNSSDDANKKVE